MTQARLLATREGELTQMLTQLDPVQDANVKLTAGDNSSMFDDTTPPSASVVLTLKPSESLTSDQAKGIASLVAGANPGMDVKNVTITDQTGNTLWPSSGEDGDQNNASDRFAAREQSKLQVTTGQHHRHPASPASPSPRSSTSTRSKKRSSSISRPSPAAPPRCR